MLNTEKNHRTVVRTAPLWVTSPEDLTLDLVELVVGPALCTLHWIEVE